MGAGYNPYDNMSKHWKTSVAAKEAKKKADEEYSLTSEFDGLSTSDRALISKWAMKASRSEEMTGQQVVRLLSVLDVALDLNLMLPDSTQIMQQAADEFRHATLYAIFARAAHPIDEKEVEEEANYVNNPFMSIFRAMDSFPVIYGGEPFVRFMTGLFFVDLAGLMTVNVYEESPYKALQQIALTVKSDESRHVAMGRDYLLRVREGTLVGANGKELNGERVIRDSVKLLTPMIDEFFGIDNTPFQKSLHRLGIKKTSNAELKRTFHKKVIALLHLD